jgi:hypothetical protein
MNRLEACESMMVSLLDGLIVFMSEECICDRYNGKSMLLRILEDLGVAGNLLHRSDITICFAILLMSLSVMEVLRDWVCWFCRIQQDSLCRRE